MTERIRVGIDLLWLVPGVVGGTEDATVGMLDALRDADELDITLYVQRSFCDAHPDLAATYRCRSLSLPGRLRGLRVLAQSTWLAAVARRDRLDVLHCYGGVIPPLSLRPTVLTLHDVQPLDYPNAFASGKARWLATMIPRSLRAASVVAVPSTFVAERVAAHFPVDDLDIRVISHGVMSDPVIPEGVDEMRARFGLRNDFALFPAITYAHKNHATLLEAWALLEQAESAPDLVLTGGAGPLENDVQAAIERLGLRRVHRLGRVSDEELEALYHAAALLVFPSKYEGFGLPVLEAMHAGCPVVAADAASLPEVAGGAALLVDPADIQGWSQAVQTVLDDPARAASLRAAGFARAKQLEWANLTPLVVDMYRSAISQSDRTRRGRR